LREGSLQRHKAARERTLLEKEIAVEKECRTKETIPEESGDEKEEEAVGSKVCGAPAAAYPAQ
jgi:hypothetical protein